MKIQLEAVLDAAGKRLYLQLVKAQRRIELYEKDLKRTEKTLESLKRDKELIEESLAAVKAELGKEVKYENSDDLPPNTVAYDILGEISYL